MSVVTTIRGDIATEELGYTSMHEHLNAEFSLMANLVKRYGAPEVPAALLELRTDNPAFLRDFGAIMSPACATAGDIDFTAAEFTYFKTVAGISDEDQVVAQIELAIKEYGRIDGLFNVAANISPGGGRLGGQHDLERRARRHAGPHLRRRRRHHARLTSQGCSPSQPGTLERAASRSDLIVGQRLSAKYS